MATQSGKSATLIDWCAPNDLVRRKTGILLWCVPTIALILGWNWAAMRAWLWIPAFLIMGVGCIANASRCSRLHCYITGPIFLLAAAYIVLAEFGLLPMRSGIFLLIVFGAAMLAYLLELPYGRYKKRL